MAVLDHSQRHEEQQVGVGGDGLRGDLGCSASGLGLKWFEVFGCVEI